MSKDELHLEIERVLPKVNGRARAWSRMMAHALVELEIITEIKCMYDHCVLETREFTPYVKGMSRGEPAVLTIDHVHELFDGGNDRPQNLQIMHFRCNSTKGQLRKMGDPAQRERARQQTLARWADPNERARIIEKAAEGGRSPEVRKKRSESMKAHWADPERRARHAARLPRGDAWRAARNQEKDND